MNIFHLIFSVSIFTLIIFLAAWLVDYLARGEYISLDEAQYFIDRARRKAAND